MKQILIFTCCLVLGACAATQPGPEMFTAAENAIRVAEEAGGDEHAPVEMRFAREKFASAQLGMEKEKYEVAMLLVEESEINAELAIEKSRTAKLRRKVSELRKRNEELEQRLRETFGDEFE